MRTFLLVAFATALFAGCGGPPPSPPPSPEPQPAYVLEGTIYDDENRPAEGISVYLFPVGDEHALGFTRSDSTGAYRIEIDGEAAPRRLFVLFNSNRHPDHDGRFLPSMDRITRPEGENRQHRLYYLTPVSEAPSSMGNIFVIKPVCNLRSAPTTESSLVGRVRQGQSLEALERDGDWFWVETRDGTRGWIHRMLVTTLDHRMPE